MNTPTEELFEIKLTAQGANSILRTFKIVQWTLILAVIYSSCFLFLDLTRYVQYYSKYDTGNDVVLFVQLRIEPLFMAFATILSIVQIVYYFNFIKLCKRGIDTQQSDLFSQSFTWMLKNAIIMFITAIISIAFIIFNTWSEVDKMLK
ncbi:MAG: hypothetical protein DI539_26740 [Flavobacterium psychrophilum]|nr:MAG: hypothetical protein DI539_26740 [Flavobacterium psychrophilum]